MKYGCVVKRLYFWYSINYFEFFGIINVTIDPYVYNSKESYEYYKNSYSELDVFLLVFSTDLNVTFESRLNPLLFYLLYLLLNNIPSLLINKKHPTILS